MRLVCAVVALIAIAPVSAVTPDERLARMLAGRTAGTPMRCIRPDRGVQPEIIDGKAIVYRDARQTYVARFKGGCPALREGRITISRGAGGQLCTNDPVRIAEATGTDFGFCAIESFTPYAKR